MAERDRFELDLGDALRAYAVEAPTEVRPAALARRLATTYPHRRPAIGHWGLRLAPAMAMTILLAVLLTAVAAGMLVVGSRPPESLPALVPATPGASPTTRPDSVDGLTHAPGRAIDSIGDATGYADIVAVTTSTTADGELVFEIDLAHDWPAPVPNILRIWLNPDRQGSCNAWIATYTLVVAGEMGAPTATATLRYAPVTFGRWFGTPGRTVPATNDIAYTIDGPRMTVVVPLAYLANPQTVGFRLFTPVSDEFPNGGTGDMCYEIALAAGDVERGSPLIDGSAGPSGP